MNSLFGEQKGQQQQQQQPGSTNVPIPGPLPAQPIYAYPAAYSNSGPNQNPLAPQQQQQQQQQIFYVVPNIDPQVVRERNLKVSHLPFLDRG
jgi:hypothetical protein